MLFLVKAIMKVVRNIVDDVRFTYFIEAIFVPACGIALRLSPNGRQDKEKLE